MRRIVFILFLIFALMMPVSAQAESSAKPILYTFYRQVGWGDRIEIGYVDSKGGLWVLNGNDSELHWPYQTDEQIHFLSERKFEKTGTLAFDDFFAFKSLVSSVSISEEKPHPAANDAGIEQTYAIRYDNQGSAEPVLLGVSGDDFFENTDPDAQSLYRSARLLFPNVTSYAGDELMGPMGFIPVSISSFLGLKDLSGATVQAYYNDCEAGPSEIILTEEEQAQILDQAENGMVTGKVSAIETTGGFWTFYFNRGEEHLGQINLYDGLLYCSDGMYSIDISGQESIDHSDH